MKSLRWPAVAVASWALALGFGGCSAGDDEGDGTASGGLPTGGPNRSGSSASSASSSTSSGGSSSGGSSSSSGGSSSSGSSSSSGGLTGCTLITPAEWVQTTDEGESLYSTTFTPALPSTEQNELHLAFHAPGDSVGTYDLGAGANADADTCEQCVSALAGTTTAPSVFFFQHEGQLDVTLLTFATVTARFTGVQLAEVDRNGAMVAGGTCLRIADGTIEVEP